MIEQSSIIAIGAIVLSALGGLGSFLYGIYQSSKIAAQQENWQNAQGVRDTDKEKTKNTQQRKINTDAKLSRTEDKRHHTAIELLMIPSTIPLQDETPDQEWTRDQLDSIRSAFQGAITEVNDKLTAVANRLNTTVTTAQYMDHEAVLFKAVADGASIRDEIKGAISSYQEEGVDPDEIQRRILTTIGESLLQMAKTPVPPPFPARDYGITDLDAEGEQING